MFYLNWILFVNKKPLFQQAAFGAAVANGLPFVRAHLFQRLGFPEGFVHRLWLHAKPGSGQRCAPRLCRMG